jgi:flagellar hook-length control protein FliK
MFSPLPNPGATHEETLQAMLKGSINPGGQVGNKDPLVRDGSENSFSRFLAEELESSGEGGRGGERTTARGRTAETPQGQATREQGTYSATEESGDGKEQPALTAGQAGATEGEGGSGTLAGTGLAESLAVWSGLDFGDLSQVNADPAGRMIPGPVWQNGLPVELKTRLAADIAAHFTNRGGRQTLTIKLDPEHLGKLDIQLQAKEGHLSVRLLAANPESETALKENLRELAESIQKQSGRFQQVEVRVELKPNGESADRSRDEKPDQSSDDKGRKNARQGQDQQEEPHGWNDEAQAARSEAPVQGG